MVGIDAVFGRLAGCQEFQAAKRQAAMPVTPAKQRHQAGQAVAVMEQNQPQLPAAEVAVDAPPGQEPVGCQRQLVARAAFEQRGPGGGEALGLAGSDTRVQVRGMVESIMMLVREAPPGIARLEALIETEALVLEEIDARVQ